MIDDSKLSSSWFFKGTLKKKHDISLHSENKNCKENANKVMQLIYYTKLLNNNQTNVIDHRDKRTKKIPVQLRKPN